MAAGVASGAHERAPHSHPATAGPGVQSSLVRAVSDSCRSAWYQLWARKRRCRALGEALSSGQQCPVHTPACLSARPPGYQALALRGWASLAPPLGLVRLHFGPRVSVTGCTEPSLGPCFLLHLRDTQPLGGCHCPWSQQWGPSDSRRFSVGCVWTCFHCKVALLLVESLLI